MTVSRVSLWASVARDPLLRSTESVHVDLPLTVGITANRHHRTKLDRMRPADYGHMPEPRSPEIREPAPSRDPDRRTHQGVRDLNGPRANGSGYNGARYATCPHFRDPQAISTHTVETLVIGPGGFPATKRHVHCSSCGEAMGEAE